LQIMDQSTPAPLGSLFTTAISCAEPLRATEPGGAGWKAIVTAWEAGAGGFCTLNVLPPPPHPANINRVAVERSNATHVRLATVPRCSALVEFAQLTIYFPVPRKNTVWICPLL
jgi:hypothetical protein